MNNEPRTIKNEADVLITLLSYLHLHYLKVSETDEPHVAISVDPVELTQCIAVLARAQTMRGIQP
jgi:hypothetical protein